VHLKSTSTLDDTLDVFPCHGAGGMGGMLATGVLARDVGLLAGETRTMVLHLAALILVSVFAFVASYLLYWITDRLITLRVPVAQEAIGLDISQHNEFLELDAFRQFGGAPADAPRAADVRHNSGMSRFGPDPQTFFDEVYRDTAPWDIGVAQPSLLRLIDDLPPRGPVLDVGCGSGDLSIALAGRGLTVRGVDFVAAAVLQAQAKVQALEPEVAARLAFDVADALRPSRLGRFGAVVDSGFYHLFDQHQAERFARDLASALVPGGRYYLLAFASEFPIPNTPRAVSAAEVRARFPHAGGWRVLDLRDAEFQSRIAPVPAVAACIERV
jgi:SAM-dependent methyltransferase